jgi:hypothetical protein
MFANYWRGEEFTLPKEPLKNAVICQLGHNCSLCQLEAL